MRNFLDETLLELKGINKSIEDIDWIGSEKYGTISIKEFLKLADFKYDIGYGGKNVPADLVIVFLDDSWLERCLLSGSEDWAYHKMPQKPKIDNKVYSLQTITLSWRTLKEIQEDYLKK